MLIFRLTIRQRESSPTLSIISSQRDTFTEKHEYFGTRMLAEDRFKVIQDAVSTIGISASLVSMTIDEIMVTT